MGVRPIPLFILIINHLFSLGGKVYPFFEKGGLFSKIERSPFYIISVQRKKLRLKD